MLRRMRKTSLDKGLGPHRFTFIRSYVSWAGGPINFEATLHI